MQKQKQQSFNTLYVVGSSVYDVSKIISSSVSIHYMSLVQYPGIYKKETKKGSFNTLYVVGSIRKNRAFKILL